MKIFDGIEFVGLGMYTNKTLIVSDFHMGYEEGLNKKGILVPRFQFSETIKRLDSMFARLKRKRIEKIIVNGDLKHEFGSISDQEWRHTLKLLDYFSERCKEIILVEGNHDKILEPIAKKRNVRVVDYYVIESANNRKKALKSKKTLNLKSTNKKIKNSNILVIHGDKIPDKKLLEGVSTIVIGHEHPAVSIEESPRIELFKAFLIGKWKRKNLIVLPSFNLVTEGNDVINERRLSPFLKGNLKNFEVVVAADKLYRFGKVKDLG
tara:strand:- start:6867 stop:7661 length:795 start_codon:yes stop_codon:yes gene_type:complete